MSMSPTQLSLRELRKEYDLVQVVEYWNSFTRRRHDLFGCWDIMAVGDGDVCLVQTTTKSNISARVRKISDNECLPVLRDAGVTLIVHGWYKDGRLWKCKTVDVS
jgi:hypothetical protein